MRKLLIALAFFVLSGVAAKAQTPRIELFTGLSYGQFNPGGSLTQSFNGIGRHFSMPGVEATPQFNLSRWFGIVGDISAYGGTGDVDQFPEHLRFYNYLAGPQLTARGGPFNVFVRGLAGTSHARVSLNNSGLTASATMNRIAYGFGGGIDLNATKHIALRLVQVDYLKNSFTNCLPNDPAGQCTPSTGNIRTGRQNNLRAAAGFEWRF